MNQKKNPVSSFEGLHYHGMVNPANTPISEKIAKMAHFNPCMNFYFILPKDFLKSV